MKMLWELPVDRETSAIFDKKNNEKCQYEEMCNVPAQNLTTVSP